MPFVRAIAAAMVAVCLQPAWAARPLATDDTGVIGSGDCEFEASRTVARLGVDRTGETGAALACGVGFGTQLGLGYGQARGPEGRARGVALTAKAGLWSGAGDDAPSLAVSGAVGWGRAAGQSWEREASEVRLLGTWPVRHAFIHANLGHARSHTGGPKATVWGLALEHQPAQLAGLGWAPLVEVYGDDRGDRWVNFGVRTTVWPDRLFVDLAHARQQAPDKARVWNAGLRLAF